jgi:hypothetical protein
MDRMQNGIQQQQKQARKQQDTIWNELQIFSILVLILSLQNGHCVNKELL